MECKRVQAYGAAGVIKVIRILEREVLLGMRMLGARSVSELVPEMVGILLFDFGGPDAVSNHELTRWKG